MNYKVIDDDFHITINNSTILIKDEIVENGVIHVVDKVILPSSKTVPGLIAEYNYFDLFYSALIETAFEDTLLLYNDEKYASKAMTLREQSRWGAPFYLYTNEHSDFPLKKYYKYTGYIETDEVFAQNGIHTLDDMKLFAEKWYGTEDRDNPKSPKNALYKFVAYHFTEGEYPYNGMVYYNIGGSEQYVLPNRDRYDYFEMFNGKLCKVMKPVSSRNYYEIQNIYLNYSKREMPYNVEMYKHLNVRVIPPTEFVKMRDGYASFDPHALNGVIHPIDKILIYNEDEIKGNILYERMRFSIGLLLPELASNGFKYRDASSGGGKLGCFIPPGFCRYAQFSGNNVDFLSYYNGGAIGYMYRMFRIVGTRFDMTLRLPRVLPGTYEIRIGYNAYEHERPITLQLYLDGKITGLPWEVVIKGSDPRIGFMPDKDTDDDGYENDKQMRLRGYMKAPDYHKYYYLENGNSGATLERDVRDSESKLRRIITKTYLSGDEHYLRIKQVTENESQFEFDFIEIVPLSIVSDPMKPEDRK